MTVSSEAKRTLVKSPPELWSEVSDAESLARHLDSLEQIRITHAEPETAVEWEADGACGSVRLQPSGFGTKVTLWLSRELPAAEAVVTEPEPASEPVLEPVDAISEAEPEPSASESPATPTETEPSETAREHVEPDTQPTAELGAIAIEPVPVERDATPESSTHDLALEAPRQGFFARLFKRRRKPIAPADDSIDPPHEAEPVALVEPESMPTVEPELALPLQEPDGTSEPSPEPTREPAEITADAEQAVASESEPAPESAEAPIASVIADLATLEAEMAAQDQAMLTAMLDRLGAAHHRPFSRA